jgi:hypothetical protein
MCAGAVESLSEFAYRWHHTFYTYYITVETRSLVHFLAVQRMLEEQLILKSIKTYL